MNFAGKKRQELEGDGAELARIEKTPPSSVKHASAQVIPFTRAVHGKVDEAAYVDPTASELAIALGEKDLIAPPTLHLSGGNPLGRDVVALPEAAACSFTKREKSDRGGLVLYKNPEDGALTFVAASGPSDNPSTTAVTQQAAVTGAVEILQQEQWNNGQSAAELADTVMLDAGKNEKNTKVASHDIDLAVLKLHPSSSKKGLYELEVSRRGKSHMHVLVLQKDSPAHLPEIRSSSFVVPSAKEIDTLYQKISAKSESKKVIEHLDALAQSGRAPESLSAIASEKYPHGIPERMKIFALARHYAKKLQLSKKQEKLFMDFIENSLISDFSEDYHGIQPTAPLNEQRVKDVLKMALEMLSFHDDKRSVHPGDIVLVANEEYMESLGEGGSYDTLAHSFWNKLRETGDVKKACLALMPKADTIESNVIFAALQPPSSKALDIDPQELI